MQTSEPLHVENATIYDDHLLLVKGKTAADGKVETIASNHLHELPEIAETLRTMSETLRRMEVKMGEEFSYLRGKLNGRG